ncbi:glutathione S-transferase family protein [Comamonas flocculans]|uniref:Glutathione S-transferase family protein n=1 Tax=Comamonas flocculans TaxID=2597701 RepID=A0A5B8RWV0_9BURK|nr:glutathione S-transferase family protein [Comamonas flocculans]QEA13194.1 glutathione S-transferase family protein [Comamonas flocculans]
MIKFYTGNKNYSSWSMRVGVLLAQAQIAHEETVLRMDGFGPDSNFKRQLRALSPTGKVPLLVDGDTTVWESLAIVEYLAERFPEKHLWPQERAARARARSVVAELHAGFGALRQHCSMSIEAHLPEVGALIWRDQAGVRADVARVVEIFSELLGRHGGPMLFGDFSIADAYYAPMCMRFATYELPLPPQAQAYVERVRQLPGVKAWVDAARAENDFLAFEEPYRLRSA